VGDHNWKGNFGEDNGFYGKKHSEETLRKMSECKIGKVNCFDKLLQKPVVISKEDFHKQNNIRYVSVSSKNYQNLKNGDNIINETRSKEETIGTYVGKQIRLW
jgi:hypothetical protein